MEKLVCEICGGRLIMGQKDTFECESCGSCYSREWAKQKVQEIQGTVKVEGTVQVEGTVKLDGPVEVQGGVSLENLLKRGKIALEDQKWEEAPDFFHQALNFDPECAEAYLGLFLAEVKYSSLKYNIALADLESQYVTETARSNFNRALQFASPELKQAIETAKAVASLLSDAWKAIADEHDWEKADTIYDRVLELDPTNAEAFRGKAMVCWKIMLLMPDSNDGEWYLHREENEYWQNAVKYADKRLKKENQFMEDAAKISMIQKRNSLAKRMIVCSEDGICALRTNGTVLVHSEKPHLEAVRSWSGIVKIVGKYGSVWGLRADGTVLAAASSGPTFAVWNVEQWNDIVNIFCDFYYFYGVKADGTILLAGDGVQGRYKPDFERVIASEEHNHMSLNENYHCFSDGQVHYRSDKSILFYDSPVIAQNIIDTDGKGMCLKSDGTVHTLYQRCCLGKQNWTDVLALYNVDKKRTLALRSDGTILTESDSRPLDLSGWKLFDSFDTLEQELEEGKQNALEILAREEEEKRRQEEERRQKEARQEAWHQELCQRMDAATTIEEYRAVMHKFSEFIDYKDSRSRISQCKQRIHELKEEHRRKLEEECRRKLDELNQKRAELRDELSKVGFFDFKRKKELQNTLQSLSQEIDKLTRG